MSRSWRAATSCTASRRLAGSASCSAVMAHSVSRRFFRAGSVSFARAASISGFIDGSGFCSSALMAARRVSRRSGESSCRARQRACYLRAQQVVQRDRLRVAGASTVLPVIGVLVPCRRPAAGRRRSRWRARCLRTSALSRPASEARRGWQSACRWPRIWRRSRRRRAARSSAGVSAKAASGAQAMSASAERADAAPANFRMENAMMAFEDEPTGRRGIELLTDAARRSAMRVEAIIQRSWRAGRTLAIRR